MTTIESIKREMEYLDNIKDTITDGEYLSRSNSLLAKWNELSDDDDDDDDDEQYLVMYFISSVEQLLIFELLFDDSNSDDGDNL